jgi:hypothetical protein
MDRVCFALPVLEGKTEDARAFFKELEPSARAPMPPPRSV